MEEQRIWARGILVLGGLIMTAAMVLVVVGIVLRDRGVGWLLFYGLGIAAVGLVMLGLSIGLRHSADAAELEDDGD